jgi:hypothetical protein
VLRDVWNAALLQIPHQPDGTPPGGSQGSLGWLSGDHLGTTRPAQPRTTCTNTNSPHRALSRMTCGNV